MKKEKFFYEAINQAIELSIKKDKKVILMGLGVDDPKGVFGTTLNLKKKFQKNVYDLPTSENGFTGFALGLAISKFKPIIVHQRVEFSLLSMEQIINQIAKWFFMSGGKVNVPMVIRLIIGKGWGQGPQHSQSLESIFAHIPGLKVVSPSNAYDAKGMLLSSIEDPDPVIFFEHRWLHNTKSFVPEKKYKIDLGKAKVIQKGSDIAIISYSNALVESIKAAKFCKQLGISVEILDLRSLRPLDKISILKTARKIKKVLIVDNGMITNGVSAEVAALINENINFYVKIKRIGVINPVPSSISIAKDCYPEEDTITKEVLKILNFKKIKRIKLPKKRYNPDQPDEKFKGPF
jgi:pyruvate/2-oxoglutarate/acetoin dehydrogenase E1 component